MSRRKRPSKGKYGRSGLPVAKQYLLPKGRNRLVFIGIVAAVVALALVASDFLWRDAIFVSNGPLSSGHAVLDRNCAACHTPFGGLSDVLSNAAAGAVTNDACTTCHERHGDELGIFSFAAHYVYRSDDFQKLGAREHEVPCAGCHTEHLGREADITRIDDASCQDCHAYSPFEDKHPEFEVTTRPDDDALAFAHLHHTREVMREAELEDVERACLFCHEPEGDGRGFEDLSFDRHCDACHLTTETATPRLPVLGPETPGVVPLEDLAAEGAPGTRWALFSNPTEYRRTGPRLTKAPVHHADPWILENLRRFRRSLYPDAGLADLLRTSADVPEGQLRTLYKEAIATLEEHALGLRSQREPEVQAELDRIEQLLDAARRALEDPAVPLDETEFDLALDVEGSELTADQRNEIEDLVEQLTQPCQACHRVENATIDRVQTDQSALRRAEFDHRAHVLQVRCLECHTKIDIEGSLHLEVASAERPEDRAAIQNLPQKAVCVRCHTAEVSSNRCVTCHEFHPQKDRRSDLVLTLPERGSGTDSATTSEATSPPASGRI